MSLNAQEIGQVSQVLDKALRRAVVREVIYPARANRIVLVLRTPGTNHYLQMVADRGITRIGRIGAKPRAAKAPHPFVMLLRKEIVGMVVERVTQVNDDRVVDITFTRRDRRVRLVFELTSRHCNIFWVDPTGSIGGSFFPNRSRLRRLVPGEPYTPPLPHPMHSPPRARFGEEDIESRIDAHYTRAEADAATVEDVQFTRRLIRTARRRLEKLHARLSSDLDKARTSEALGTLAHVLKAHLKEVEKGARSLRTVDFEGTPVEIPLDPKKSAVENMTCMFDRAKRFARAGGDIGARLGQVKEAITEAELLDTALDEADEAGRETIRRTLLDRHPFLARTVQGRQTKTAQRLPYREYTISGDVRARVGRNARDNDALTLRHAKPNDLWLHVRGGGGSHVVVPMNRGQDPSSELLVDAAHLAAHFSSFRKDADVEVIYTRRRYVQKPKGAAPGAVRVIREKTIRLRVEEARLRSILEG